MGTHIKKYASADEFTSGFANMQPPLINMFDSGERQVVCFKGEPDQSPVYAFYSDTGEPYRNYVEFVVNAESIYAPTQLFYDVTLIPECVKLMVDYTEIPISTSYLFSTRGEHIVHLYFDSPLQVFNGYAFFGCDKMLELTLPCFITNMKVSSMAGTGGLRTLVVANGNPKYDSRGGCNAIIETESNTLVKGCNTTVIPNTVSIIGDSAFHGCSFQSITLPSSVTSLQYRAFYNCYYLKSITIPSSVVSIGEQAFESCYNLNAVSIGGNVQTIGSRAFHQCTSLTSLHIPASVTSIGDDLIGLSCNITSITVASGNSKYDSRNSCNAIIETATNTLIAGCSASAIPATVAALADYAFEYQSLLTAVAIPAAVTNIGTRVFACCERLSSITVDSGNSKYDSRNGCNAIIETATNTLIAGCSASAIPNTVTTVGESAFYMMPSSSITIPSSVKTVEDYAFYQNYNITAITIPDSVNTIKRSAFQNCGLVDTIVIGSAVSAIGDWAFNGCRATSFTVKAITPPACGVGAIAVESTGILYVPSASLSAYKQADVWKDFAGRMQGF